jgi:hypothetical protein
MDMSLGINGMAEAICVIIPPGLVEMNSFGAEPLKHHEFIQTGDSQALIRK